MLRNQIDQTTSAVRNAGNPRWHLPSHSEDQDRGEAEETAAATAQEISLGRCSRSTFTRTRRHFFCIKSKNKDKKKRHLCILLKSFFSSLLSGASSQTAGCLNQHVDVSRRPSARSNAKHFYGETLRREIKAGSDNEASYGGRRGWRARSVPL